MVPEQKVHISIVIPVYGCSSVLQELHQRLLKALLSITDSFEIIMVNDACPDDSWAEIKSLAKTDHRVIGINLSRNFGQHRAITAGLDRAAGEWVVVMDCDLQDRPEEIPKLYNKAQEGFDVVFGRRTRRKDTALKRLGSSLFYTTLSYFTDSQMDSSIANFSIISSKVASHIKRMREQNRFYPLFVNWLGFKRADIDIEHAERSSGKSAYTFTKMIDLALDGIVSQSNKPLKLSIIFGFTMAFSALAYASWLVLKYFLYDVPVEGWTSVMVSIYLLGGVLFSNLGLLGLYLGKAFDEAKHRPLYVVMETTESDDNLTN